jgi:hypothetical protein
MILLSRCYGWSWAPPHASQRVISSGTLPLFHDGFDVAVYLSACTLLVPGLDRGKDTSIPYEMKGASAFTLAFLQFYHSCEVINSTALRADWKL